MADTTEAAETARKTTKKDLTETVAPPIAEEAPEAVGDVSDPFPPRVRLRFTGPQATVFMDFGEITPDQVVAVEEQNAASLLARGDFQPVE